MFRFWHVTDTHITLLRCRVVALSLSRRNKKNVACPLPSCMLDITFCTELSISNSRWVFPRHPFHTLFIPHTVNCFLQIVEKNIFRKCVASDVTLNYTLRYSHCYLSYSNFVCYIISKSVKQWCVTT